MRNETYNRSRRQQQLSIWNVLVIIVITLVIGIGLYILFEDQPGTTTQRYKSKDPTQQREAEELAQRYKPGEAARNIIAQIKAGELSSDLGYIFTRAQEFSAENRLEDAHLLLFYAARSGHVPSARLLGGMYDPNNYEPAKSIIDKPDLTQAYKWYKIAADSGDEVAKDRLAKLKVTVKEAADKGNEEAKILILKWN